MSVLTFLNPWMLTALIAIPVLWWLLRLVPPRPNRIDFPPLRLLLDTATEETPAKTPWWLTALRLGLAALIILALAGPVFDPAARGLGGNGPLVLLVDDTWPAAADWDSRHHALEAAIGSAESANRPLSIRAISATPEAFTLGTASQAREQLRLIAPQPSISPHMRHIAPLEQFLGQHPDAELVWLSDGLETGDARAFAETLARIVPSRATVHLPDRAGRALTDAQNAPGALTVRVLRAESGFAEEGVTRAYDARGRSLGDAPYSFKNEDTATEASFALPVELRNDVARIDIPSQPSAGAVQLLDGRWRRRTVGVISGATSDTAQPLISPTHYVTRALAPFADVRLLTGAAPSEAMENAINDGLSVLMLADVGTLTPEVREAARAWMDKGGVLIRFAGARLAASEDDLVPAPLRRGGRVLGGALAWATPQKLGAFPPESPFAGLKVPDDITVTRQVLAEPNPDLPGRTWATLADGTPLVTAERQGKGLLVLFHVSADTSWSNLPLSGLFVEMLQRLTALAGQPPAATPQSAAAPAQSSSATPLAPLRNLDGFGRLGPPAPMARAIPGEGLAAATPENPPGLYGPQDSAVALNTLAPDAALKRLDVSGLALIQQSYAVPEPHPLAPWLIVLAAAAFLLDSVLVLLMGGAWANLRRRVIPLALAVTALGALHPAPARAQDQATRFALEATLATRLAYVQTGDAALDALSKAGLTSLTSELAARTAFEPGEPLGVDPARDELAFFPLLYWPIAPNASMPSQAALQRADAYMKQGGTILFDTRDALQSPLSPSATPAAERLRAILSRLDIPELEVVRNTHVLTKTFYLLDKFPGRFNTAPLWAEALPSADESETDRPARPGDGVSPVLITGNDFAGAWATDTYGSPLLPGASGDNRQREMAVRAGVNIVMYALTGNYKADQVHVPALLERLGQ